LALQIKETGSQILLPCPLVPNGAIYKYIIVEKWQSFSFPIQDSSATHAELLQDYYPQKRYLPDRLEKYSVVQWMVATCAVNTIQPRMVEGKSSGCGRQL
jgi:hypothetical protein